MTFTAHLQCNQSGDTHNLTLCDDISKLNTAAPWQHTVTCVMRINAEIVKNRNLKKHQIPHNKYPCSQMYISFTESSRNLFEPLQIINISSTTVTSTNVASISQCLTSQIPYKQQEFGTYNRMKDHRFWFKSQTVLCSGNMTGNLVVSVENSIGLWRSQVKLSGLAMCLIYSKIKSCCSWAQQ